MDKNQEERTPTGDRLLVVLLVSSQASVSKKLKISALEQSGIKLVQASSIVSIQSLADKESIEIILFDLESDPFEFSNILVYFRSNIRFAVIRPRENISAQIRDLEAGATESLWWKIPPQLIAWRLQRVAEVDVPRERKRKEIRVGKLVLDPRMMRADYEAKYLPLTAKQFRLLCTLAIEAGRFVRRDTLITTLRQDGDGRALDMLMNRLRRIIEKVGAKDLVLESSYGRGYRLLVIDLSWPSIGVDSGYLGRPRVSGG